MILKCVARCRCSGKVTQEKVDCLYTRLSSKITQEKVDCLYTRLSSHEQAECFHRRFRVSLGHQINTQSN